MSGKGDRPAGFDQEICKRRSEVERTIDALMGFRAVATRYGKRAHVFHGIVTVAVIRLRLRAYIHCPGARRRLSPFS
ncbi:hypothetical protein [Streptomyces sp. NPDC017993]|uniref:hypothetical protein n=1 Tax=Streptomyces sp. NPDC017993 TaxID=3365027 RepID=UPI0037BADD0E